MDELEEERYYYDKKDFRKERKLARKLDRSKYKKTDAKKKFSPASIDISKMQKGRVLLIEGQRILVQGKNTIFECSLAGRHKKVISDAKTLICVGDIVYFEKENQKQGQIKEIAERTSFLARQDPLRSKKHLIATNVDILFIVISVVAPPLKPFLIDRYLITAKKGNMHPILLINKIDLLQGHPEERILLEECILTYESLGYTIIPVSVEKKKNLHILQKAMKGKTSTFAGQSGVGKTSLINAVVQTDFPVQEIREKTKKGKHTTSKAMLIPLDNSSFCVDTPGIKSFGLWDVSKEDIVEHFSEFSPYCLSCQYKNCKHLYEPFCNVKKAVEEEKISLLRYESYQTLMEERK